MPLGKKSSTSSGKFSTLRKLFTKSGTRPSFPIQHPQEKSEDSLISNVSSTKKDATLTLRTLESVLLASEELDTLTSHRWALHSLATKYKDALVKVQKCKATNEHQQLTAEDEQLVLRVLTPLTEAEQHAYDVTSRLLSLFRRTVGSDIMLAAQRDRKSETRALVYLLVRLRLDQEEGAPASDAQKQLFEKVAKLSTQLVNERKLDAKDDAPSDITPTEHATKGVALTGDTAKDDVPNADATNDDAPEQDALMGDVPDHDALDHDAQYDNAPRQAGENIMIAAGRFISLEYKPQTADDLGDTQKEILAEIRKLCIDFHTVSEDGGKTDIDDSYQVSEDIRCLAESINKRFAYILAKVETKSASQRQELIMLVNLNLNHFMEECRKDVKRVEERNHGSSSG